MKWSFNIDPKSIPEPTCQMCGENCDTWEIIYTGDEESHEGMEVWNYCKICDIETFHFIQSP